MTSYDYVIVGAGSAGCVLADKLSADPSCQVLLIEAGGGDRNPVFHIPKAFAFTIEHPTYSWQYQTEPFGPLNQTEKWSRGRVLGGSSAINGMVYNRGMQADWDGIAELGNPGWGWADILPIYRSIEDHELGSSATRGTGGPLHISVQRKGEEVSEALIESGTNIGLKRVEDINDADDERIGYGPGTIKNGLRQSAAKAFLRPAIKRSNLTVLTDTTITKILCDGDDAIGVTDGSSQYLARREVILSLGCLATPQLLELSGIGSKSVLDEVGIDVRVAHDRIGEGVREHRWYPLQMRLNSDIGYNRFLATPGRQAITGMKYLATRKGPLSTPAYDILAFLKSSPEVTRPDAQLLLTPFSMGAAPLDLGLERRPGLSIIGYPLRPTSLGSIHVRSKDPKVLPRIVPNYVDTGYDRKVTLDMFRRMRDIVAQLPIADMLLAETMPGAAVQDDQGLIDNGLINGGTSYHASGAVPMGADDSYPVDARLRVRGVGRLRVMDASVLPRMVAGNLNGPMMAMAYRAAQLILEDA